MEWIITKNHSISVVHFYVKSLVSFFIQVNMIYSLVLLALPLLASAKVGLDGCEPYIYNASPDPIFYCPLTGEICDLLECSGSSSPVGCPGYKGPASYSPAFVPSYTPLPVIAPSAPVALPVQTHAHPISAPASVRPSQSVTEEVPCSSSTLATAPSPTYVPHKSNVTKPSVVVSQYPTASVYMNAASGIQDITSGLAVIGAAAMMFML
jgi:hypothetical protein